MSWQRGIYAITDSSLLPDDERLIAACEAALQGGLALLQYRDKSADDARRWRQSRALAELCRRYGVPLIINDDLALAHRLREAGFDGVGLHLGEEDGSLDEARRLLGSDAIVGASCYASLAIAERSATAGASYLAFGRFFASHTKPEATPASLELLDEAARFGLPRVAIGGLDVDNVARVRRAGGDLLATVHAVFGGGDPAERVALLRRRAGYA
ncbi:thiamine phosphate synthase [Halomonas sp. HP20-15]|uniref:thiamine phosphate synthase n=1 Tax=Halomonas sp. HP20-15 TaxID=3085901 RepID=UPI00298284C0|nr:thiamine phosphate synthase [Halomonas sp. HP20-15]MDW5375918.1 thiamine phosphate synthase [Halomonas sp. HP20-15]